MFTGDMTQIQALIGFYAGLGLVVAFFIGAYLYTRHADRKQRNTQRD